MNLQNIPKMLAGYNLKRLFIPDSDKYVFVNMDWKGAEVRVFTAYARDPALIKALNDGLDMHSFFAATVFKRPYEDYANRDTPLPHMDEEYVKLLNRERTQIKRVVFGILYGAGPKKIAEQIGVSAEEGQKLIDMLFDMFPAIRDYIDEVKFLVARDGYVDTIFGRRRRFPLQATSRHRGRAERQACNFKIQSTSSDIVIAQLIEMHEVINSERTWPEWGIHKPLHTYGVRLLLTVHDSIGFQWPKELIHALEPWVRYYCTQRVREKFTWLPVPFACDIEVGPNYGDIVPVAQYIRDNYNTPSLEVDEDDEAEIFNTLRNDAFDLQ
jgi:DNA polymerase-1